MRDTLGRRRARRADAEPLKELPPEVLLRRARLGAVRPDHVAARVLPDALRAHDPEPPRARHRGAGRAEELVELGSGTASKTRALLYAMAGAGSLRALRARSTSTSRWSQACAASWSSSTPGWTCTAWSATSGATSTACPDGDRRLFAFLGGTIGNLYPPQRAALPARAARADGPGRPAGDRHRPGEGPRPCSRPPTTTAQGVTAEFNRNVLRVINDGLGADFEPEAFEHVAFFDRGQLVDRDAAAGQRRPARAHRRRGPRGALRRRRGDPHRDQRQVHARGGGRASCAPPACGSTTSSPTTTRCSASPWPRPPERGRLGSLPAPWS